MSVGKRRFYRLIAATLSVMIMGGALCAACSEQEELLYAEEAAAFEVIPEEAEFELTEYEQPEDAEEEEADEQPEDAEEEDADEQPESAEEEANELSEAAVLTDEEVDLSEVTLPEPDEIVETITELVGDAIPSVLDVLYNAYELGLLPAIRTQQPYGDCWAFTGIGAMESDLIADEQADTTIDLSEFFLAYFVSHSYPYPKEGGEGDSLAYEGDDSYLNNGGNNYMVFRMLANLLGTVSEEDAPYPGNEETVPTRYAPIAAQITGAYMINSNDRDAVKQAILDHGAVSASINMQTSTKTYAGGYIASFQSNGDKSCLYGTYTGTNHDILLVGWDDEFAVENFNEAIRPEAPGAWLVRNSWGGTGYGPNGYFWISYYDASLLNGKTTAYDATNTEMLDYCYSYDKVPYPSSRYSVSNRATVKQTFRVDGHEALRAVGVETASDNLSLAVSLRIGGAEIACGAMNAPYEGFYRVVLDAPYELREAADVEVTVTYTANEAGGQVRVPFAPEKATTQGQIDYVNTSGEGGFWFNDRWYSGDTHLKLYTKKLALENEVEALALSADALSLFSGERVQLAATLTPESSANPKITWTSSDPRIATVDKDGLVVAGRREGLAVITAMTNRGVCATCTVNTAYRDFAVLKSGNVEFDGLIHLLFTYDLTGIREGNREKRYVAFRRGGELLKRCSLNECLNTYTEKMQDGTHTYARYTCPVPIANYLERINIRMEDEDGREIATATGKGTAVEDGYDYSLSTYAEKKISNGSASMKRLAQALKDYGIAALRYIGSGTGGQTVSSAVMDLDVNAISIQETSTAGKKPEGIRASQNVVFDSDNALQVAFLLPLGKEAKDYEFQKDRETVVPEAETDPDTGRKRVKLVVPDIAPNDLNTLHTFSVSDGTNTFTVSTSVLGYAKRKAENGSADMKILAKALCNYYLEALVYIGA